MMQDIFEVPAQIRTRCLRMLRDASITIETNSTALIGDFQVLRVRVEDANDAFISNINLQNALILLETILDCAKSFGPLRQLYVQIDEAIALFEGNYEALEELRDYDEISGLVKQLGSMRGKIRSMSPEGPLIDLHEFFNQQPARKKNQFSNLLAVPGREELKEFWDMPDAAAAIRSVIPDTEVPTLVARA